MGKGEPDDMLETLARSGELSSFRELVRPLEEYDRDHKGDLVRTLTAFFEANANASEAAEKLYLHRNSLAYRMERIREITGLDLKDPEVRLALQLGLVARKEKEK